MLAGLVNLNRWLAIRLPRVRRLSMTEVSAEGGSFSTFRERIKKYKDSLQPGNSGSFVKNAARKVMWNTSEKESLARFRAEIIAQCSSINLLIALAGV